MEASTALAGPRSKNTPKQLEKHLWKPGQSGNPRGRAKGTTVGEMRDIAKANFSLAVERLAQLIKSENEAIALQAVEFTYLYALGKPPELRDISHSEVMQARHQELVAVPMEQISSESESPLPALETAPVHEATPAPASPTSSVPPEAPRESSGVSREPSGLRCLYRGKDGQCMESALDKSQWCQPHRDKLFSMVPE